MDSIDTIIANWTHLSNTPIDWSLNGGMIWLTGMTVFMVLYIAACVLSEVRKERQAARKALYREAEFVGYVRNLERSFNGFQETV